MYDWIEKVDTEVLIDILGDLMSNASEECYSAGWYEGSEYIIPALCIKAVKMGTPRPWAQGEVSPEMASLLIAISDKIGCWVTLNESANGYIKFNPFPTPAKYCEEITHWKNRSNSKKT